MSRRVTGYIAGAAFALTAAAAFAAYAQAGPAAQAQADAAHDAAGPGPHGDRHEMRREERRIIIQDGDRHFEMAGGHHRDMAEHLRTMLQLKPSQEAALTAYLAAVKPGPEGHHEVMEMSRHDEGARTTTERLAAMEKRMAEAETRAHARIDATRKFYAQLDPAQKKVFDEMPMLMIGPIGPMGPMMMPGPMKIRFEHRPGERFEYRMEHGDHGPMPPMPPRAPEPPPPPRS